MARAIARGIKRVDPNLVFVGLATAPRMLEAAEKEGLRVAREAFADRMYMPDGTLQPRSIKGSVHQDPEVAARQVLDIVCDRKIRTADGSWMPLEAETICIHGDNPPAPRIAAAVRQALSDALSEHWPNMLQMDTSPLAALLAAELVRRAPAGLDVVRFGNSGSEAVEMAMKFSRRATGRTKLVATRNGYHGLTYGALSLSGQPECGLCLDRDVFVLRRHPDFAVEEAF